MADIRRCWFPALAAAVLAVAHVGASIAVAEGLAIDDTYPTAPEGPILEDTGAVFAADEGVLANDTGGPSALCVIAYDTTGLQGTLDSSGADGSFSYTPPHNFNGTTAFSYSVATIAGGVCPTLSEGSATVTITVTPVNDAPTAANDSFSALAGRALNVTTPGVLANDADVDGDALTAVLESGPTHGTLSLAANGSFTYTPDAGYSGSDVFSYHASDGTEVSQPRVVALTVAKLPPSHPPTAPPAPAPSGASPSSSPTASPSESPLPADSGLPSSSPLDTGLLPSPSPSSSLGPLVGDASSGPGIPIFAIAALGLLIGLLTVAGVFFVQSQRRAAEEGAFGGGQSLGEGDAGEYDADDLGPDNQA